MRAEQFFDSAEGRHFGETIARRPSSPTLQTETNIGRDREMREQPVVLKDEPDPSIREWLIDASLGVIQCFPRQAHLAFFGPSQPGYQPEQGRLAGTRRSEEDAGLGAHTQEDVERERLVDPVNHACFQGLCARLGHCESPRLGRVRCTTTSARIAISEIQKVSQPARFASLT